MRCHCGYRETGSYEAAHSSGANRPVDRHIVPSFLWTVYWPHFM